MLDNRSIIKVYLDTCILSNLRAIKHIKDEQLKCFDKICDYDFIDFVTSYKTLEEFLQTREENTRIVLKVLYKLINKIPYTSISRPEISSAWIGGLPINIDNYIGWVNGLPRVIITPSVKDELFFKLEKIFKHKSDAEHVYQSEKGGCNYFMTLDENSILKKARKFFKELKVICPNLEFVNPKELLEKINVIINKEIK